MFTRLQYAMALACLFSLLCLDAKAQQADAARAQVHLDAARVLVNQEPPYRAALQYVELAGLEHRAGRDKQAKELGYLLRGLMEEDKNADKDSYIHLIARVQLEMDETEDAARSLAHVAKPSFSTKNLHLEVAQQLTRRFGLQRGVTYAREQFPDPMTRRDVYCKLCYTLAANGQVKTAREFIDITLDLTEIFSKIDAYRFAAIGLHKAGDTDGAVRFLEDALKQAAAYPIASTRASMCAKLAITFDEIGQSKRGLEVLALAEAAVAEIEPDDFRRDGEFDNLAEASAIMGQRDRSLYWVEQTKEKRGSSSLNKRLVENDLLAGNTARAKQLSDDTNAYFGDAFKVRVALAKLERGDASGALADFTDLSQAIVVGDWHREAASAFARRGQHTALAALLPKIKGADHRFAFHLGAAQGYLCD